MGFFFAFYFLYTHNIPSWKKKIKRYLRLGTSITYVQVLFSLALLGKGQEVKEIWCDAGQKEGHGTWDRHVCSEVASAFRVIT